MAQIDLIVTNPSNTSLMSSSVSKSSSLISQNVVLFSSFKSMKCHSIISVHKLCICVMSCSDILLSFIVFILFLPLSRFFSPHQPLVWSHSVAEADNKLQSHRTVCSPSGFRRLSAGGGGREGGEAGELRGAEEIWVTLEAIMMV